MKFYVPQLMMLFVCIAACIGCSSNNSEDRFDFNRLVGRWEFDVSESAQYEEWQAVDGESFRGRGFVLISGDTTFIETLEIKKVNNVWTYLAQVSDSPAAEAVPFALARQSERKVEFANAGHDFPKRIGYEFISDREMQVYLEGPRDGQNIRIMFDFKRSE